MGGERNHTCEDDTAELKDLAKELKTSFNAFYKKEKKRLERRQKDLSLLKKRAKIKQTCAPAVAKDLLPLLYSTVNVNGSGTN